MGMDNLKKNVAIVGLGKQSINDLIPMVQNHPNCILSAVCDISQELIDKVLTSLSNPSEKKISAFLDYKKLFESQRNGDLKIDFVVISVPHFLHFDICKEAIKSGVPVFKEKPFALNLDEAKRLKLLSQESKVPVYTVTKRQFYPSYNKGQELLKAGTIGTPYMYSVRHFIAHGNLYEGWRSKLETAGGGVFMDMGYHLLDVIVRYFGSIEKLSMAGSSVAKPGFAYEVEDAATLHFVHNQQLHGLFEIGALTGPKEEKIEVRGSDGQLIINEKSVIHSDNYGKVLKKYDLPADGLKANIQALNAFLSGEQSIIRQNLEHNLELMKIMDKVYH